MATEQSVLAVIRASRPNFRNSADKISFAIHSIFLATGFNLNATGQPAFVDDALAASFSDEAGIDGWNEVEDNYAFVYSSPEESSKKVLVKCLVKNNQLFIDALAAGSSDPVRLEINIDDFIGEGDDTNYGSQFKNLGKLVDCINKEVITKLNSSSRSSTSNATTRVVMPPVYPSNGGGGLYPQPGVGMYATRDGFGDGGMLVGPNDPRFFGGVGGGPMGFPGGLPGVPPGARFDPFDPTDVPGFEPNLFARGVPPGARFDPFNPPDVPGFEPSLFARNPRRPPGGAHLRVQISYRGLQMNLEHFGNGSYFI